MADSRKRCTFTWKIDNFSMFPHQKGEIMKSETFEFDIWKGTKWSLQLCRIGDKNIENDGHISAFFEKTPAEPELKLNFTLALESTDSSSDIILKEVNRLTGSGWGYSRLITLKKIYEAKNLFLPNDTLTLRLELSPVEENSANEKAIDDSVSSQCFTTDSCICRTSILVHRRSMMWPIECINKRRERQEDSILLKSVLNESPSLKLSCNFSRISQNEYIPIAIRQTCRPLNKRRLFVKCKMSVINARKECQVSAESTHLFGLELDDVFHFPPFIKTSYLTNDAYLYQDDDTLLLRCDFAFSYKSDIYHSEFNRTPLTFKTEKLRTETEFFKSLEDLYMQGKFCDVHLQAGDEDLPACKMLLCARSNVFTAMFELNMKEKNSNVVEITDVEPTTLKRMLEFIHVDAVKEDLSPEDACKLYEAADKYNIDSLRRMSAILLTSSLSVANVCDVLALADAHEDNFLMDAVRTFISNYSTEIFHSIHWETFIEEHPKLAIKIMHQWIKGQQF